MVTAMTLKQLAEEHGILVHKHFSEGLTEEEEARLTEIRAEMDVIEQELHGSHLDHLEAVVASQEHLAAQIMAILEWAGDHKKEWP